MEAVEAAKEPAPIGASPAQRRIFSGFPGSSAVADVERAKRNKAAAKTAETLEKLRPGIQIGVQIGDEKEDEKGERMEALKSKGFESSTQRGTDHLTKLADQGITQGVHDALPVTASLEDFGMEQERQVLGDVGLRGACVCDNIADMAGVMAEGLENAEPHGFAEYFKEGGDGFELRLGERR